MDYNLTFFAWFLCQSNCQTAEQWQLVVKVDYGIIKILNPKFDLDTDGSLILKDIQPSNDHNWVRCFFHKPTFYKDHRSTIIRVAQGNYTELFMKYVTVMVEVANGPSKHHGSRKFFVEFHGSRGFFFFFLQLCASRSLDFSQSCLGVSSGFFFKAKKVPRSRLVFRLWLICFYNDGV